MDPNAQKLFDYLRDVLYSPADATLDIDSLSEDFKDLGKGLVYFGQSLTETRVLAKELSKGNLDIEPPGPQNELAAPLKNLQASLKHITWQTQQVAKGDYKQRVDFMGAFSDAFNIMIRQLDHRQKALEDEIDRVRLKSLALEQSNDLFELVSASIQHWIVVLDREDGSVLFTNHAAAEAFEEDPAFVEKLQGWMLKKACRMEGPCEKTISLQLPCAGHTRYLAITACPVEWRQRPAASFVVADVSDEQRQLRELENVAYRDPLTHAYSRLYGMRMLEALMGDNARFCVIFADLDNLKFVNDNYGHAAGDRYIIGVCDQLRKVFKDSISRLGGDEFMVLAEGSTAEEAEASMLEITTALGTVEWPGQANFPHSISYGIVGVEPEDERTASEVLSIADERMYQHKRARKRARGSSRV